MRMHRGQRCRFWQIQLVSQGSQQGSQHEAEDALASLDQYRTSTVSSTASHTGSDTDEMDTCKILNVSKTFVSFGIACIAF